MRARGNLLRRGALVVLLLLQPFAVVATPAAATSPRTLHVYVRDECPHCVAAKEFLARLSTSRSDVRLVYRPVDHDEAARQELVELTRAAGLWPPGVPSFAIDGRLMVGFGDAERSGAQLVSFLDEASVPAPTLELPLVGRIDARRLGLPAFTLALGLLDGFNPCAIWVLLFLLSLLVRLGDRRRMAMIAGTFVVTSAAVYYAFLAAWLNVFLAVGMSETLRWVLGALAVAIGIVNVKDFFAWKKWFTLSIPDSAKPRIYARVRGVLQAEALPASMMGVAALAVVVNFVELLCTAGFPAIYTAVLTRHELSTLAYHSYLGLYVLAYMADDTVMVAMAVFALSRRKLGEDAGRRLKLVSGIVMLALGLTMLVRPDLLM